MSETLRAARPGIERLRKALRAAEAALGEDRLLQRARVAEFRRALPETFVEELAEDLCSLFQVRLDVLEEDPGVCLTTAVPVGRTEAGPVYEIVP